MKTTTTYAFANTLTNNQAYWPRRSNNTQKNSSKGLSARLRNLLHVLVAQLSGSSEPYVWEGKASNGQTVWNAQDRATGNIIRNASETEMRVWLERRFTV